MPHTQKWLEYWDRPFYLYMTGQDRNAIWLTSIAAYRAVMKFAGEDPSSLVLKPCVRTTLKRLQQLERPTAESLAANGASGARERILEKINAMADPRRGDPNWEAIPRPTVEEVMARIREAVSRCHGEVAR